MADIALIAHRDRLQRELQALRASRKNLDNTIRNVVKDMEQVFKSDPIVHP